jgi:hypothetical protein
MADGFPAVIQHINAYSDKSVPFRLLAPKGKFALSE